MKMVGLLRDLERPECLHLPSIADLRDRMDPADLEAVVAYLQGGRLVVDVMGFAVDPLNLKVSHAGGQGLQCDGEYVWRQDLWYYVRFYRTALAEDFVARVRSGRPPALFEERWCPQAIESNDVALQREPGLLWSSD